MQLSLRVFAFLCLGACRGAQSPCDRAMGRSELEGIWGSSLKQTTSGDSQDCVVSWRRPDERAFVTFKLQIDRSELRDAWAIQQLHAIDVQPFAVVEDRTGPGYAVHTVLSLPNEAQVAQAQQQLEADVANARANPSGRSADPIGDALSKGPADLHQVSIKSPKANVYLWFSRFSTTREQVSELTNRIAQAVVQAP